MNQLELNVIDSFRRAKSDIIHLQNQVIKLSQKQEELMNMIADTKEKETKLYHTVKEMKPAEAVKIVSRPIKKEFVASREGSKFHIPECPFAKNIKPKSKIIFKTKSRALNVGYKPCNCVQKI